MESVSGLVGHFPYFSLQQEERRRREGGEKEERRRREGGEKKERGGGGPKISSISACALRRVGLRTLKLGVSTSEGTAKVISTSLAMERDLNCDFACSIARNKGGGEGEEKDRRKEDEVEEEGRRREQGGGGKAMMVTQQL